MKLYIVILEWIWGTRGKRNPHRRKKILAQAAHFTTLACGILHIHAYTHIYRTAYTHIYRTAYVYMCIHVLYILQMKEIAKGCGVEAKVMIRSQHFTRKKWTIFAWSTPMFGHWHCLWPTDQILTRKPWLKKKAREVRLDQKLIKVK